MTRTRLERLAPLTGLAFVILAIVSGIVGGEGPDADASTQEVVDFWSGDDSAQVASSIIGVFAAIFLVWFAGSAREMLRRAGGVGADRLAAINFAGFVIVAIAAALFSGLQFTAADTVGDVPDEVTQTVSVLYSDLFFPFSLGVIVAMASAAVAILRYGTLPRWLGYLALVALIGMLTGFGFFVGLIGAAIWIVAVAILGFGEREPSGTAPPASGTTA